MSTLPGGTDKIKKDVAQTGMRDTTTSAVVNCLLELGKKLRTAPVEDRLSENEIRCRLEKELEEQIKATPLNPLIGMRGKNTSSYRCSCRYGS